MKLFFSYLRQKRAILLLLLLCDAIFLFTFFSYSLPLSAVLYPCLLCTLVFLLAFFLSYARMLRRHRALQKIIRSCTEPIPALPAPQTIEEGDLCAAFEALSASFSENRRLQETQRRDMVDYYTLWVHQIKTPIASMHLQLQGQDSRLCRALQGDLFRIEQYVEMVLTYLRLDTRETDYVFRPCDIDALTRQCIKKFSAEFIRRGLALEYTPCPLSVVTDEKWLAFVIEQLLSNALKYTKAGTITVAILPQEKLIIRDTGIGIAPQDLPRIFENGFSGFNGRTDKKASGIGLYLSKRILDNLGCKIEVLSALGKGTEVSIDLSKPKTLHE